MAYTNEQLEEAIRKASDYPGGASISIEGPEDYVATYEVSALRRMIDALEPYYGENVRQQAIAYRSIVAHPFFDGRRDFGGPVLERMLSELDEAMKPAKPGGVKAGGAEVIDPEDARAGDRVLIKSRTGDLHEVTLTFVNGDLLGWRPSSTLMSDIERMHLLRREIRRPDPEKHPLIRVRSYEFADDDGAPTRFDTPQDVMWIDDCYENDDWALDPERIVDWVQLETREAPEAA